eukprot:GILK01008206.1.p1 GENE.GILK01008206.1~~GILK01008206.1.p1  ORF type:complete len:652 (-),score=104.05 GILK01008206.1:114-2036(-)
MEPEKRVSALPPGSGIRTALNEPLAKLPTTHEANVPLSFATPTPQSGPIDRPVTKEEWHPLAPLATSSRTTPVDMDPLRSFTSRPASTTIDLNPPPAPTLVTPPPTILPPKPAGTAPLASPMSVSMSNAAPPPPSTGPVSFAPPNVFTVQRNSVQPGFSITNISKATSPSTTPHHSASFSNVSPPPPSVAGSRTSTGTGTGTTPSARLSGQHAPPPPPPPVAPSKPSVDQVEAFLGRSVPLKKRFTPEEVGDTLEGLQILTDQCAYRSGLKVAENCLKKATTVPERLQLSLYRIMFLMRLKNYQRAEDELRALGSLEAATYRYENYPAEYPGRTGSMVPFSLRLFHGQLPHYLGDSQKALDRLYNLLAHCESELASAEKLDKKHKTKLDKIISEQQTGSPTANTTSKDLFDVDDVVEDMFSKSATGLRSAASSISEYPTPTAPLAAWRSRYRRVSLVISGMFITQSEYLQAIRILKKLLEMEPTDIQLQCILGRIYLQMGDIAAASSIFQSIEQTAHDGALDSVARINRGLLYFALGQFKEALEEFRTQVTVDSTDLVAVNNFALASLYCKELQQAIEFLEQALRKDPVNHLNESLIFNLCTLYDLALQDSAERKKVIQDLVARYGPEDFDASVFRLPVQ